MEKKRFFKEYAATILVGLAIALLIRTFVVQTFYIPSGSMRPTLLVGDYIAVNKFIYGIRVPFTGKRVLAMEKPQRGDVIVFLYPVDPSKDFIKRVIATGGQKVQIVQNRIYIDDKLISDPWGYFKPVGSPAFLETIENFGPVVVPEDALFVMGDNRDNSDDSRFWGFLPLRNVIGEAFMIYFSWNGQANSYLHKVRWSRIGKWID